MNILLKSCFPYLCIYSALANFSEFTSTHRVAQLDDEVSFLCKYNSSSVVTTSSILHLHTDKNGMGAKVITGKYNNNFKSTINQFTKRHAGDYKCLITHENQRTLSETTINVEFDPPSVIVTPESVNVKHNETATIRCDVTKAGKKHSIRWKNSQGYLKNETETNQTSSVSFFNITDPKIYHNDSIICELKTSKGEKISNETKIFVQFRPNFPDSENHLELNAMIGESIKLDCTTLEHPAAISIKWYKVDANEIENLLNLSEKVFKIDNFIQKMAGDYFCVIENEIGNATKIFKVNAIPERAPEFENLNNTIKVKKGDPLQLECSCEGCLPLLLNATKWTKNNESINWTLIQSIEDELTNNFTSIFYLKNVTNNDNGEYKCNLENSLGNGEVYFNVHVQFKPENIRIKYQGQPIDNHLKIESFVDVNITCLVDGYPKSEIKLYKDSNEITQNSSWIVIAKEDISTASGEYRCVGKNEMGEIDKIVTLGYKIPLKLLSEPFTLIAEDVKRAITLDCRVEGFPQPTIIWSHNEKTIATNGSLQTLELILGETHQGTYTYLASNGIGENVTKAFEVGIKSNMILFYFFITLILVLFCPTTFIHIFQKNLFSSMERTK